MILNKKNLRKTSKKIKKCFFQKSMPRMYINNRPRRSNVGDCNTLKLFLLRMRADWIKVGADFFVIRVSMEVIVDEHASIVSLIEMWGCVDTLARTVIYVPFPKFVYIFRIMPLSCLPWIFTRSAPCIGLLWTANDHWRLPTRSCAFVHLCPLIGDRMLM